MLQPYLSSFQNWVICLSIIQTFCSTSTYVKAVSQNIGKIALCRKNGHFQHKLTYVEKTTCQIEPNFFTQVDFKVIQKRFAVITEILIFRDFRGSKSKILTKWRISHYARTDKLLGAPLGILSSWVSPPQAKHVNTNSQQTIFLPKSLKMSIPPQG